MLQLVNSKDSTFSMEDGGNQYLMDLHCVVLIYLLLVEDPMTLQDGNNSNEEDVSYFGRRWNGRSSQFWKMDFCATCVMSLEYCPYYKPKFTTVILLFDQRETETPLFECDRSGDGITSFRILKLESKTLFVVYVV